MLSDKRLEAHGGVDKDQAAADALIAEVRASISSAAERGTLAGRIIYADNNRVSERGGRRVEGGGKTVEGGGRRVEGKVWIEERRGKSVEGGGWGVEVEALHWRGGRGGTWLFNQVDISCYSYL